jgi:NDP-sugar pyrophosphorylase family protein
VKAMVLAAGEGRRLRPMTDAVPKPMVSVAGEPVLGHALNRLADAGVRDVVINLHYRPEAIQSYCGDGSRWGIRITYSPEPTLQGTAGALRPWRAFFDETFLVVYGDNIWTCALDRFVTFHRASNALATVALFRREDAGQSGVADVGEDGRIKTFVEKPGDDLAFSRWVNAGVLALEPKALGVIPEAGAPDFGRDLLPTLLAAGQPVFGYRMTGDEKLWWIDTPRDLERAERELRAETTR